MTARDDPSNGWLRRGLALSLLAHAVIALVARFSLGPLPHWSRGAPVSVDIEVAPPAPKAEEPPKEAPAPVAAKPKPRPHRPKPAPPKDETAVAVLDAGVDGDGGLLADSGDAGVDGGVEVAADGDGGVDGGVEVAADGDGGVGDGGLLAAGEDGGTGDDDPNLLADGTVSPGTAADLLSYFPEPHVVTVLMRFDRLRGSEWAAAAEKVLAPMPDYRSLVGDRDLHIADLFETMVVSSFDPRRVDASTLVARTSMKPAALRAFLDQPDAPVAWSVAQGGMLGRRGPSRRVFPGDERVFLSPYEGWLVLAPPADLEPLLTPAKGALDTAHAPSDGMPPWLERVHGIESESGAAEGPAMVVTASAPAQRLSVPNLGLGVTSMPTPIRATVAMSIEPRGFVARGNLRFASDAEASEFVDGVRKVRERVLASSVLQAILKRGKALNAVQGLTVVQRGSRVSYATSISIADGRALLRFTARKVKEWYDTGGTMQPVDGAPPP